MFIKYQIIRYTYTTSPDHQISIYKEVVCQLIFCNKLSERRMPLKIPRQNIFEFISENSTILKLFKNIM